MSSGPANNSTPQMTVRPGAGAVDHYVTLDFEAEDGFYGWVERSRQGAPILRLEERLEEGGVLQVDARCGAQRDSFRARVQQVFRSGADRWGHLLGLGDQSTSESEQPSDGSQRVPRGAPSQPRASDASGGSDASDAAAGSVGATDSDQARQEAEREAAQDGEGDGIRRAGETYGASAFFEIKQLNPNQRMMLATRANRQQRQLLLRETSQPVQMALLSNPRLEPKEVLEIAKNPQTTGGVLQRLANDPKFSNNYEVQLALVRNPQTPSPLAIRLLELMRTSDLRFLAKSQALRENVRKAALRVYLKRSP